MPSRLNTKLIRDLRFSPYMFGGIVLLLFFGIALFGASYGLYLNLERSYQRSYDVFNLADFSVPVRSAPTEILSTIRRIPGVQTVEGRTIEEVEIELPESTSEKVIGRLISLPDSGEPRMNQLRLLSGSYPGTGESRELLLEASFAEYHDYQAGDILNIVVDEEDIEFRVSGIVQSVEYIFVVRGREYPFPTPRTFGVMWVRRTTIDDLFGTSGSVNDISVLMAPDGNRRTAMRLAGRILDPYGADNPIPQEDQPSVELLRLDLLSLQGLALFFPVLFLTIASLSVYNLIHRMVYAQRNQIGFLRAVGFSRWAVGLHYLEFSLVIGVAGGVLGAVTGHFLSIWVTRYYTRFIQVPAYDVEPRWGVIAAGFMLATVICTISGILPAIGAARLTPAEAIGSEAPTVGRAPLIERFLPFLGRTSLLYRLPLRNFLRNPRRTASTVAGVASAAVLLLVAAGLLDSTRASINFYLEESLQYDILVSYLHPQQEFVMEQIERWPGVRRVEPLLALPARLVKDDEEQNILVYGLSPDNRMLILTNNEGDRIPIQQTGIMIADSTARRLDLWRGGTVRLTLPQQTVPETPEIGLASQALVLTNIRRGFVIGPRFREEVLSTSRALLETRLDRTIPITGITYQPVGNSAYASIEEVRRWYGAALELPPGAITGVAIQTDPAYINTIEDRLYDLSGVASVEVLEHIREEIEELLKSSNTFFLIMLSFSVALAAVIMFNSTLMNVIERTREIATLRTLGLRTLTTSFMIWAENLMAYLVGIAIGLPLGRWMAAQFVGLYESESFSMRTVIFFQTYALTILGILATVIVAQIPGLLYIRRIELARATKDIG